MAQYVIVALLVSGASGYSVWTLMPSAWRAGLLRRLGRSPSRAGSGCGSGCGGCGDRGSDANAGEQIIRFQRR